MARIKKTELIYQRNNLCKWTTPGNKIIKFNFRESNVMLIMSWNNGQVNHPVLMCNINRTYSWWQGSRQEVQDVCILTWTKASQSNLPVDQQSIYQVNNSSNISLKNLLGEGQTDYNAVDKIQPLAISLVDSVYTMCKGEDNNSTFYSI